VAAAEENIVTAGYWTVLKGNRNYRSLWSGEVVSLFGDWFNLIASASLISTMTGSGLAVGGLFVVRMLAPFLVSPFAGVAADRYNRKRLLIFSDLARAVVVLGFLLVRHESQVWLLYVLTALQLGISGIFFPTRSAILPDIVPPRELGTANAISSITWSVMLALGAAIGGLVAGEWGIYPAFLVDSLSFLVSAYFLSHIRYIPTHQIEAHEHSLGLALRQYVDGLRYLRNHLDTLAVALQKSALSLTVNGAYQVIQVVIAERIFVIGEGGGTGLGWLYAVGGLGTGLGPLIARRFSGDRSRPMRRWLAVSYGIMIVGLVLSAPLTSFGLVMFGNFIRTFGGGIIWVFSNQLLFQLAPHDVRGRVFGTEFALMTLSSAISTAAGGYLLDRTGLGVPGLLWLCAALTVIPGLLWGLWILRHPGGASELEEAGE